VKYFIIAIVIIAIVLAIIGLVVWLAKKSRGRADSGTFFDGGDFPDIDFGGD